VDCERGKTKRAARRSHKRQLANVIIRHMWNDAQRNTTAPSLAARQESFDSTFATVRIRQRVTKGPGSKAAGLVRAFKLLESAQGRWRAENAHYLVALVRAGAPFTDDKLVERPDESGGEQQVA
jgi:hypothetical protein